ncbi:hypothetical protein [Streptomyces atroolivaceus]|uniref:hypothetical protein n=1 Tax=Streptomyces atroolivaceus TaxID=66869 RepID=UPI0036314267
MVQAAPEAANKALNPDGAEAEQDPAMLAAAVADRDKQLGDLSAELHAAHVELAAYPGRGRAGARADRLLNSRSFLPAISELDPAEKTPRSALRTMPRLRAIPTCTVRPRPDRRAAAPSSTAPREASAAPLPCAAPSPPGSAPDPLKIR